jgi:predicted AlkP superfamily phosphohydrolase/phosphomutase
MASDEGGLLFFYYSSVDLCAHMMWRHTDEEHPHHDPVFAAQDSSWWSERDGSTWKDTVMDLILRMDPVLGHIRQTIGEDTGIVVMSDHGFAPFRRKFDLNSWLFDNGYLVLKEGYDKELPVGSEGFKEVHLAEAADWSKTRAYGMGFNGLYLNLAGREGQGIVQPGAEADALAAELKQELEALVDPKDGVSRPVLRCDLAKDVYEGERLAEAPDIQVGYDANYGNSDEASVGRITNSWLSDNLGGTFNGSHLMSPDVVAGILLTNRPLVEAAQGNHRLVDLTTSILTYYGVDALPGMIGRLAFR